MVLNCSIDLMSGQVGWSFLRNHLIRKRGIAPASSAGEAGGDLLSAAASVMRRHSASAAVASTPTPQVSCMTSPLRPPRHERLQQETSGGHHGRTRRQGDDLRSRVPAGEPPCGAPHVAKIDPNEAVALGPSRSGRWPAIGGRGLVWHAAVAAPQPCGRPMNGGRRGRQPQAGGWRREAPDLHLFTTTANGTSGEESDPAGGSGDGFSLLQLQDRGWSNPAGGTGSGSALRASQWNEQRWSYPVRAKHGGGRVDNPDKEIKGRSDANEGLMAVTQQAIADSVKRIFF
ncbi:hypothetical protein TRIUR3_31909 [Triticum urartu]|uniref:Uncharacterized protein n=1 Tax=Triticum urartu TaxID=4572 RepID=M7YQ80_TRIUA|nr:hypothetical protein TRIUR3_31909 [Triticum urartu]